MTDRETLLVYPMRQTEETLAEAVTMKETGFSPRSIVNRPYYAMFYAFWRCLSTPTHHTKHQNIPV